MKIKKNGKVVDLTESEVKEIVKQYKIKDFYRKIDSLVNQKIKIQKLCQL